ncbi:hypothetical protein BCV69DRAFT_295344 [Microstroma glucosiphilum]|uniref:Uncharacterized protein n=1 Tax=Pseudomicrostroma glucosiphilum TaxID=1684307 RepID=A0A316U6D1_9BASI|nr:hypothetical protein BCV69DRAFT_295344 [Pseudomicrostroma glucosiphilum]PWN18515.1 hypothetical protein BCV69DRAFT_295344 [Pseudomicrostroma glucosiphilum]
MAIVHSHLPLSRGSGPNIIVVKTSTVCLVHTLSFAQTLGSHKLNRSQCASSRASGNATRVNDVTASQWPGKGTSCVQEVVSMLTSEHTGQKKGRKPQLHHNSKSVSFAPLFPSGGIPYTQQVLVVSSPIDQDYASSSSQCSSASSNTTHFSILTSSENSQPHTPCDDSSLVSLTPIVPPRQPPRKKLVGLSAIQRSYLEEKEEGSSGQRDFTCGRSLPKPSACYFSWPEPQQTRHKSSNPPRCPSSPQVSLSPQSSRSLLSPHRNSMQRPGGRDRSASIASHTGSSGPIRLRRQSTSSHSSSIYGDVTSKSRRPSRLTVSTDEVDKMRRASSVSLQQALHTSAGTIESESQRTELSGSTGAHLTRPRASSRPALGTNSPLLPTYHANGVTSATPPGFSGRIRGVTLPSLRELGIIPKSRLDMGLGLGPGLGLTLRSPVTGTAKGKGISTVARRDAYPAWGEAPGSPAPFSSRAQSVSPVDSKDGIDIGLLGD